MDDFQYKQPPITEAIIEFRSTSPFDAKQRAKGRSKLQKSYEKHVAEKQQTVGFKIQRGGDSVANTTFSDLDRFMSNDMTEQLQITERSIVISQLAPYVGWETFGERVRRDWKNWRTAVGFLPIIQLGIRYINRIDIPIVDGAGHYEKYLTVYPKLPELIDQTIGHSLNVRTKLPDIDGDLNLNSAVVPSPLPNHIAIMLDLDFMRIFQKPPSDDELFEALNIFRTQKNKTFEACITDDARKMFAKTSKKD